jgi:hypothetical protein
MREPGPGCGDGDAGLLTNARLAARRREVGQKLRGLEKTAPSVRLQAREPVRHGLEREARRVELRL